MTWPEALLATVAVGAFTLMVVLGHPIGALVLSVVFFIAALARVS